MNISERIPTATKDFQLNNSFVDTPESFCILSLGGTGENYKKWSKVLQILSISSDIFKTIIQVGGEKLVEGCLDFRAASLQKRIFLSQKAKAIISFSGFYPHAFPEKTAAFYGFHRSCNFGNPALQNFDFCAKQRKSFDEEKVDMESVNPFDLVKFISSKLKIPQKFSNVILSKYEESSVDVFPNFEPSGNFSNLSVNLRLDGQDSERTFVDAWIKDRVFSMTSNKEINPKVLTSLRKKLPLLTVTDSSKISEEYASFVKSLGIHFDIQSTRENEKRDKNKFFDFNVFVKETSELLHEDCLAIVKKLFVSNGKIYLSEGHRKNDVSVGLASDFSEKDFQILRNVTKNDLTLAGEDVRFWDTYYV